MKIIKISLVGFIFILLFSSCSKEELGDLGDINQLSQEISFREVGCKRYDETGCIVDEKAGIRCFPSVGKSCKKEHPCEAISEYNGEAFFSQAELSDWLNVDYRQNRPFMLHMWEIGEFIHPDSIQ